MKDPPLVCAGEIVTTCLHQVAARDLDEAAAAADAILAPVAGLPGVPERIEMRADLESEPDILRTGLAGFVVAPERIAQLLAGEIFGAEGHGEGLSKAEQVILAWLIVPVADLERFWLIGPPEMAYGEAAPEEIAEWRAEIEAHAERFAALPAEEQRAWLEANWDALRSGELTLEEMP